MTRIDRIGVAALILGISGVGYAGLDNSTALADLVPDVDIDQQIRQSSDNAAWLSPLPHDATSSGVPL